MKGWVGLLQALSCSSAAVIAYAGEHAPGAKGGGNEQPFLVGERHDVGILLLSLVSVGLGFATLERPGAGCQSHLEVYAVEVNVRICMQPAACSALLPFSMGERGEHQHLRLVYIPCTCMPIASMICQAGCLVSSAQRE